MPRIAAFAACALAALFAAGTGSAAQLIGRDASGVQIRANGKGEALFTFRSNGVAKHVLVWGAINARVPSADAKQVEFKVDYSGGWKTRHTTSFAGTCGRYDGPLLPERRRGVQGARRVVLGGAELAAAAPQSRFHAVDVAARAALARGLALDRPGRAARDGHELGVRRPLREPLRPVHVPRAAGLRVRHDAVRRADRSLRPAHLPRHVQLDVRLGLEARELVRAAQPDRRLLLRLLQLRSDEGRLSAPARLDRQARSRNGREVPHHRRRPRRDAERRDDRAPASIRSNARTPTTSRGRPSSPPCSSSYGDRLCRAGDLEQQSTSRCAYAGAVGSSSCRK